MKEKGKNKTIREPEIVKRIEAQINKPQGYTGTLIPLDDLPVSIQEVIVQRGTESGTPINDEVSVYEALEIAELLPETDKQSAVLEIEESFEINNIIYINEKTIFCYSLAVKSTQKNQKQKFLFEELNKLLQGYMARSVYCRPLT